MIHNKNFLLWLTIWATYLFAAAGFALLVLLSIPLAESYAEAALPYMQYAAIGFGALWLSQVFRLS